MSTTGRRAARIERQTKESKVLVELDLDGSGRTDVSTEVGFYDHMLTSFLRSLARSMACAINSFDGAGLRLT